MLGCGTNNELISLHAEGKVSEPEVKWIKANYLNSSEVQQLDLIEATRQGNLFNDANEDEADSTQSPQLNWQQIIDGIDGEMKRLGWTQEIGRKHLIDTYGVKSRLYLTDGQLMEFYSYLKNK